ncbi:type II toxin-antitoxin system VapC family toxin [Roseomonas haemaphysalidis]|uniref:Type II toxin-antitoxin system VapC family toxin n=1 Tax=Roseomonas haemaphysalidis TaxID=2768162 RepID=A0ABS3KWL8_9PROT|nr:type II toxin-antitoxin system VapC family toxin [Roseomonas haemaphysalidis]MBO1081863.1 type II toxin-antitoxin system VapC family toxin [Roseomonas haemaphysalidis]
MRLLLDTHLLLWALTSPERLDATTRAVLEDPQNEVLFSAASLWEIAIKVALGRSDFTCDPGQILLAALDTGFVELPVRAVATIRVANLPPHHRDPFDRLLIAQAMSEPVRLFTADAALPVYSELVTLVR